MPAINVARATQERFDDAQHALTGGGDGASCQCQWWLLTSKGFSTSTRAERTELLRIELGSIPAPALIAYVGGVAAGWVRVGPRVDQPRLARTRVLAASRVPWTDPDVWAVTCFVVRREYRRQGLAAKLLAAAVEHAQRNGARIIEGYPIDTAVRAANVNSLYVGTLALFQAAGFREVARPAEHRVIMELGLQSPAIGDGLGAHAPVRG